MPRPDVRRYVGVCLTCHHWQIDIRSGAVSDLGGWESAMHAIAVAHLDHIKDCPGAGGRIKMFDQWVEAPEMSSGQRADGTLVFHLLPAWWVTR